MEIKQAYKRADGTYVIDGYHVCPKEIDPYGKYNIAEVESYLAKHPEALIPEPLPPEPTKEQKATHEIQSLLSYLNSTDWYVIRWNETCETIPKDILAKRQEARDKISELRKVT